MASWLAAPRNLRASSAIVVNEATALHKPDLHLRQSVIRTAVGCPLHLRQSVIRTAVWCRGTGPTCRSLVKMPLKRAKKTARKRTDLAPSLADPLHHAKQAQLVNGQQRQFVIRSLLSTVMDLQQSLVAPCNVFLPHVVLTTGVHEDMPTIQHYLQFITSHHDCISNAVPLDGK